jgi:WD40 repeat protein
MKAQRIIQWDPHNPTHFMVGATDLRLYQFKVKVLPLQHHLFISTLQKNARNTSAEPSFCLSVPLDESKDRGEGNKLVLVSANYEVNTVKCMAWSPSLQSLIAVGLPNGRVQLVNFSTPTNRITKEFVPKHSRTCNSLAWNPVYNNQLAAGLDKVRGTLHILMLSFFSLYL